MVFVFVFSALVFLAGLTFLIIGIIFKSKKYYIPAIIGMIISFLICAAMIFMFFFKLGKRFSEEVIKKENIDIVKNIKFNHDDNGENSFTIVFKSHNSSNENDNKEESSFEKKFEFALAAKGFITDPDNNMVYVKVFTEKSVTDKAIFVNSVSNRKAPKGSSPEIILNLGFNENVSDTLKFFMLNEDRKVIDSCLMYINEKRDINKNFVFRFGNDSKIIDSRYYYLTGNNTTSFFLRNEIEEPEEE
jgi:energy-coupling factor transporter transmembrane protein EcfT